MRATRSSGLGIPVCSKRPRLWSSSLPGDLHEGRVGILPLHLESDDVLVEPDAPIHVGDPQDEVLQPLETEVVTHLEPSGYSTLTVMAAQAMIVSASATLSPPSTARTVTSPCGSSRRTVSMLTDAGDGTATVTSTSILPPRSRTSWSSGRLECRIASDTARQAALVESRPWTSTPMPNSRTDARAVTGHLRTEPER